MEPGSHNSRSALEDSTKGRTHAKLKRVHKKHCDCSLFGVLAYLGTVSSTQGEHAKEYISCCVEDQPVLLIRQGT